MPAPCFIGDEVGAAGFRLAGADVRIPAPGGEADALAAALRVAPLVLVSAGVAARLPARDLERALAALTPMTVVVPDLSGEAPWPDPAERLRRQLGLEG